MHLRGDITDLKLCKTNLARMLILFLDGKQHIVTGPVHCTHDWTDVPGTLQAWGYY